MTGEKVFIGPKLRDFRLGKELTQADLAKGLGVSASYINLIERNQRSASLKFLVALSDNYGINWRQFTDSDSRLAISDLRQITMDPAFGANQPDIEELRSAIDNSPNLVNGLVKMFDIYRTLIERIAEQNNALANVDDSILSSEQAVHDFFRQKNNYFDAVENCAAALRGSGIIDRDEFFGYLKRYLLDKFNIETLSMPVEKLGVSLRYFDKDKNQIMLSDALDYQNKVFQLAHSIALIEHSGVLNTEIANAKIADQHSMARCRVELANYFAAAVMMPYDEFYVEINKVKYDIDHLSTKFSASYEQVCHRLTTMQRPGSKGIPFFFLRIDRAGNVSKRFNVTTIQLARYGGACPRLDVHFCFRVPGRIMTQVVEMPDFSRYLTINRTVDRPSIKYTPEDKRLAVSLGCEMEYASQTVYGQMLDVNSPRFVTQIGVNCRLCPRQKCEQRAHEPFLQNLKLDENRRGVTRFES